MTQFPDVPAIDPFDSSRSLSRPRRLVRIGLAALAGALLASPATLPATAETRGQTHLALQTRADTVDLAGLESAFRTVADAVSPSVVALSAGVGPPPSDAPARSATLTASGVDRLLARGGRTVGTGFVIDDAGYVLTNEHVIRGAGQIYATADDGRVFPAMVIATDPRGDLAVLKLPDSAGLPAVEFARPDDARQRPRRGQWTIALGNPVGLSGRGGMSFSVGVVSALGRDLPKLSAKEKRLYTDLIQTTAEVSPGNSGGPLFDLGGRVLGVVTAVVLPHGRTHGVGFALPADADLLDRVERLKQGLRVQYGYLGIAGKDAPGGMRITSVGQDTPAAGKLHEGDLVLRVDGQPVDGVQRFIRLIGNARLDHPTTIVVQRHGDPLAVRVRLVPRPDSAGVGVDDQRLHHRGVTFRTNPKGGVRVSRVAPDSPLADRLRIGQAVQELDGTPVACLVDLQSRLDARDVTALAWLTDAATTTATTDTTHGALAASTAGATIGD
jgi:S1-C subfamily serine protease